MKGTIKVLKNGFGFIKSDEVDADVFFHANNLEGVENCVCKNLHSELFSSLSEESERKENNLICEQITKYKWI